MAKLTTRRTFGIGALTALAFPLAGCLGDDDDDEEEETNGGNGDDTAADGTDDSDAGNGDDGTNDAEDGESDSNDDDEADDEFELGEQYDLTVHFENEDGEPVSQGMFITLEGNGQNWEFTEADVVEGTFDASGTILREGEYEIVVEGEEFGSVEEEFTLDEDTEFTMTLEGAVADADREDEEA